LLAPDADLECVRIVLVAETFLPATNGVVNCVLHIARELAAEGHTPVVVAPAGGPECLPVIGRNPVPVRSVPATRVPGYPGLRVARPGLNLIELLSRLQPDVVHLASPFILGWAATTAIERLGLPSVSAFQTDLSGFLRRYHIGFGRSAIWALLRRIHSRTDLTLAPSTASADLLSRHGIGPIALWRRGVDSGQFHPRHRSDRVRAELGCPPALLVGFVGRLAAEKRVHLLEPISRLPDVRLLIVGDGPRRPQLERLMPTTTFLGAKYGIELSEVIASLDLQVNPGADETFCQVVQEGLASGVPAIVAATGGPRDLVRHDVNGWWWTDDDPATLAALVIGRQRDRAGLGAAAATARGSVVKRSWASITGDLLGHYRSVIAARAAGSVDGRIRRMTTRSPWPGAGSAHRPGGHVLLTHIGRLAGGSRSTARGLSCGRGRSDHDRSRTAQ
jgi:phosphatidylinositol alpha 1,6-mannosyltransferase